MLWYDLYSWLKFKKRVQISTTEYCNKVTYNHMRPFTSTIGSKAITHSALSTTFDDLKIWTSL